jgi:hypothetical protein
MAIYRTVLNDHIQEYRINKLAMFKDITLWSLTDPVSISAMSLVKQAQYADYVTKKMMTKEPRDVHRAWIKEAVLPQLLIHDKSNMHVASFGNLALILMYLSPSDPLWISVANAFGKLTLFE